MTILDIILLIPLVWAIWAGYRKGIVVQLGGIAGLLVGVWLAFRYGTALGKLLRIDPSADNIVGFIIILVATIIIVAIIGRLLSGLFRFAGLGILDKVGGIILSVFKIALILGLLLYGFDNLNKTLKWVDEDKLSESALHRPLTETAKFIFPYVDFVKNKLIPGSGD